MAAQKPAQGFGPVLSNRHFLFLWLAQILGNTASNGLNLILLVLVEHLTGSTVGTSLVVMAFTIPGVLFSPVAGVVVDRWPKKAILFWSNALRVISLLLFVLVLYGGGQAGPLTLPGVYAVAFLASTIGQFFGPTEASTIPLLVTKEQLLPANSLFGITLSLSQVVGLVIFGPTAVKLLGFELAFVVLAIAFALASLAILQLPGNRLGRAVTHTVEGGSGWSQAIVDLREGWQFVTRRRNIYIALSHFALIATLLVVLQALGPGFARRVLGLAPEDSVIIFAPAGVGMVAASFLLGRFGYRVSRKMLTHVCLIIGAISLWLISVVSSGDGTPQSAILRLFPERALPLTSMVVVIFTFFGLSVSVVNILASTDLQEHSPNFIRGRVFAVQFMLNNLLSILPLLVITVVADQYGIPVVFAYTGLGMLIITALSAIATWRPWSAKERDLVEKDRRLIENETRMLFGAPAATESAFSTNEHQPPGQDIPVVPRTDGIGPPATQEPLKDTRRKPKGKRR